MYEEIMKSSRNSFFMLLNEVFPGMGNAKDGSQYSANMASNRITENRIRDNEWMQEYHIIYNSYILEGNESSVQAD